MNIVIPFEGRVRTCIRSSYILAKRLEINKYTLTGDTFQMTGVTPEQIVILPDSVKITEGQELTDDILRRQMSIEQFISVTAEEALPNVLGLLLRIAVADGRLTDEELLSVKPALEDRLWQPGIAVQVGDVYTFGAFLWRCIQAHTTQGDWAPDLTPSLWHKVEIISEDAVRVWDAGLAYLVGDVVAYPDADGILYTCLQAHNSQTGWEPPTTPSLWQAEDASGDNPSEEPQYEEEPEA
ncbi:MAG: hypothetical protein J6J18_11390 [Oscillospiraceae bacterium]|jgi:hypothetical protein|nr:hypothetical protein [Oscillospiraceae bacterium]MBQ4263907.1 hypothetical protein [Clostridia bacterium]MBR6570508.1 hypothetical protein [Clostridia bacterium]